MIHSEDDSKIEQIGTIDENQTDVFDLGYQDEFLMEVNQISSQQGLSPRGPLLNSKKETKQNLISKTDHTTKPFTRSHSHEIAK